MKGFALGLRNSLLLLASTALVLGGTASCTRDEPASVDAAPFNPQVCATPKTIPAGFDYPQSATTLAQWSAQRNEARMREHGWYLWAALNTGGTSPVWRTWCTSTQAFASATPSPSPSASAELGAEFTGGTPAEHSIRPMLAANFANGDESINFSPHPDYPLPKPVLDRYKNSKCIVGGALADGPTFENNGDVMIAGVTYDPGAYGWIRTNGLYQTGVLGSMMPPQGKTNVIPPMPSNSVVLKPMLWPVKKGGFTALPLWDNAASDHDKYAGFEIQSMWPRAVAITTTPAALVRPASVPFLYGVSMSGKPLGPNIYANPPVVGTNQFYNYTPDLRTMNTCDRALLDASAYWAYGRMFEQGDQLVLVAMHIITKEQSAWTFQSVWWHDRPDAGPYAANRPNIPPGQAPGPWRHYLLASTYGIPAVPNGKQWPIQYNPYIELAASHPIATNCMNCHHRAAWPGPNSSYEAKPGPNALDIFDQNNPIFANLLLTDSMWAISDRVPAPSPSPAPSPTLSPPPPPTK